MSDEQKAPLKGFVDGRGIYISAEGMARARARRLAAQARISAEDTEALRARYHLRPRPE